MSVGGPPNAAAEPGDGSGEAKCTGAGSAAAPARGRPRVAAVVLAAGRSSRMGDANKLLCAIGGEAMIARVVDAACSSACVHVVVVTGFEAAQVEAAVAGRSVSIARNADFRDGIASSLVCGLKALPQDIEGALILLGDMPCIAAADIDRLIAAFDGSRPLIVVPSRDGRRGNPVLWPRRHFARLRELRGDSGGRCLLEELDGETLRVAFDSDAIFVDADTPTALEEINSR